jgi:RimJ/RimL family protein N-acetyltransferase
LWTGVPAIRPLFARADIALVSGGQTLYEALSVGTPAVVSGTAVNQARNLRTAKVTGAALVAGWQGDNGWEGQLGEHIAELAQSYSLRRKTSRLAQGLVDGQGARRVAAIVEELRRQRAARTSQSRTMTVTLRLASVADRDRLRRWRNDPQTRANSRQSHIVSSAEHRDWLNAVLADRGRHLYIAQVNGRAVGTVRADLEAGVRKLSWTVAPGQRGKGFGKAMVAAVARRLAGPLGAEVKTGNSASVRIAMSAGLTLEREADGIAYFSRKGRLR